MKTLALILSLLLLSHSKVFAQCQTRVIYYASKIDFLDEKGNIQKSETGDVTIDISPKEIVINHNNEENDRMKGQITDYTCNWVQPYKQGKTKFRSELYEHSGDSKDAVIEIEGRDDHLTILLTARGRTVRVLVDKYEEKS